MFRDHSERLDGAGRRRAGLAVLLFAGLIAAFAALVTGARAANYSYPATYSGSAVPAGTVEFDTAADGASVTRFAVSNVLTTCGIISGTTTGTFPIANESFSSGSSTAVGIRFNGSFPAVQQAQGTLSFRIIGFFPASCTSADVPWTATTSTPPRDTVAPQTTISSGPSGKTGAEKATFRFRSSEAGSTFQCKLDAKPWSSCRSPKAYRNLKDGRHIFKVRARDAAGNVDPTPAKRSWRVEHL